MTIVCGLDRLSAQTIWEISAERIDMARPRMRIAGFRDSALGHWSLAASAISLAIAGTFSCGAAKAGLVITPTFDSTITSDANAAAIENVITGAIATYETTFVV